MSERSAIVGQVNRLLNADSKDIYRTVMRSVALEICQHVVTDCKGNMVDASEKLGISRMTLRRIVGLKKPKAADEALDRPGKS